MMIIITIIGKLLIVSLSIIVTAAINRDIETEFEIKPRGVDCCVVA